MDSFSYLLAALAVTIIGILVYVYYLGQRTRELRRDLAAMDQTKHPGRQ